MKQYHFIKFADPGHGWVEAPHSLLVELGIMDRVSSYSYINHNHVYLEEDCDASLLHEALESRGYSYTLEYKHTNDDSRIRSFRRVGGAA